MVVTDSNNQLSTCLVRFDEPIFKIPNLAIHLTDDRGCHKWNAETHLKAILSTTNYTTNDKSEPTTIDKVNLI